MRHFKIEPEARMILHKEKSMSVKNCLIRSIGEKIQEKLNFWSWKSNIFEKQILTNFKFDIISVESKGDNKKIKNT